MSGKAKNLVFFPDSPFADWIINRCERLFPGLNYYVSFGKNPKYLDTEKVKLVDLDEKSLRSFSLELNSYRRIIIHYHHDITGYLIELAKVPSDKIIWMLWSGDLYNTPFYKGTVYLPRTKELKLWVQFEPLTVRIKLKEKAKELLKKPGRNLYKNSFKRIKNIGSFFPKDVELASSTFGKSYNHIFHGIVSVEEQVNLSKENDFPFLGDAILVGHSGVPELNHLDTFDLIAPFVQGKPVICPLSYGNTSYISVIKDKGKEIFKDRFYPILEFMPRNAYFERLKEASVAVFGSVIHQGFGNIMTLLYLGFKVYMFQENPIYVQLVKLGLILYPLNEVDEDSFSEGLSEKEKMQNRKVLLNILSEEKVDEYYKSVYQFSIED